MSSQHPHNVTPVSRPSVICDPDVITGPTYAVQREMEGLVAYVTFGLASAPALEIAGRIHTHVTSLMGEMEDRRLGDLREELSQWHWHFHHPGVSVASDLEDYKMRVAGHRLAQRVRDALVPEVAVVTIGLGPAIVDERVSIRSLD